MTRHPIALAFPSPYPPLPTSPHPSPSPLQTLISTTLHSSDYDAVCIPLTNGKWQERWEQLCLRPAEDEDAEPDIQAARDLEREKIDRQADVWRKEGGLRREEVNVCRLEETQSLVGIAAEWLELDSPDEGIRFDSELVRPLLRCGLLLLLTRTEKGTACRTRTGHLSVPSQHYYSRSKFSQPSIFTQLCSSDIQSPPVRQCLCLHSTIHSYTCF